MKTYYVRVVERSYTELPGREIVSFTVPYFGELAEQYVINLKNQTASFFNAAGLSVEVTVTESITTCQNRPL